MPVSKWWYYIVGTVNVADCTDSADPSCLSFTHRVVFAQSEAEARAFGQQDSGFHQRPGVIRNDYVIPAYLPPSAEHGA